MSFVYLDPILGRRRKGTDGDEFVPIEESVQVTSKAIIQLTEIPDRMSRVQIPDMVEVREIPEEGLQANEFFVDYAEGFITVHSSLINTNLVISYMGTGAKYFPVSRVWTKEENNSITETLDDIIEAGKDALDNLDRVEQVIIDADNATENANQSASYATNQGDYAKNQGDYAKNQGEIAEQQGLDAETKGNVAQTQGNIAENQGNLAEQQGLDAESKGNVAEQQGNTAEQQGNIAETKGTVAENQGNIAEQKGNDAETKGNVAESQGNIAEQQGNDAEQKGLDAESKGDIAQQQGDVAEAKGNTAEQKGNIAEQQGLDAEAKGNYAQTQGDYAKIEGDYAQTQGNYAKDQGDLVNDLVSNTKGVGEYEPTKTYYPNNFVAYSGSTYMALVEVQGVTPNTNASEWQLVAQRGLDGSGSVVSVNGISPDMDGNVELSPNNIGLDKLVVTSQNAPVDSLQNSYWFKDVTGQNVTLNH